MSQPALPRSHLHYKIPLKSKSVHLRSHLAEMLVHFADMSPSQNENCEYEHSQESQSGQAGLNIVHNITLCQLFTNFINENKDSIEGYCLYEEMITVFPLMIA